MKCIVADFLYSAEKSDFLEINTDGKGAFGDPLHIFGHCNCDEMLAVEKCPLPDYFNL
jgi:hypothetical protein